MVDVREHDDLTGMTFDEIAAKHGEKAAINAGIAADPDTFELDEEWFEGARPVVEVDPELVAYSRRTRGKQRAPTKERVTIRLDADLTAHFRAGGARPADPAERDPAPGGVRHRELTLRPRGTG